MQNKIYLPSPGKINLYLDVVEKREDGYHNLEMIMQKISLSDEITLEKAEGIEITCSDPVIPTNSDNIVHKGIQLISADHPQVKGAKIHIEKNIPSEAGLAGGSSNAAATIKGISILYELNLSLEEMCHYGEQLGSDVNFFFYGPTCHVSGRGDIIKELKPLPALSLVLVKPEVGLSAGAVYRNLHLNRNLEKKTEKPKIKDVISAVNCEDIPFILNNLYNKLEESSFRINPDLKKIKETLIAENPHSLMSGSGTTFFSLFSDQGKGKDFFNKYKNDFHFSALTVFTTEEDFL